MSRRFVVVCLVVALGAVRAALAQEPAAPRIISWSNSKTGDKRTVLQVKPGERIIFKVESQGTERYQWEIDTETRKGTVGPVWYRHRHKKGYEWREFKVQEGVRGNSFTWTVPGKGIWKIRVTAISGAWEEWTNRVIADCAKHWKKDAGGEWSRWMRDALTPTEARTEWIVSTTVVEVNPGKSIQAAIDSLPSGGGVVKLLPGTHVVKKTVVIKRNNVAVVGTRSAIVLHDTKLTARYERGRSGIPGGSTADRCFDVPRGGPYHDITFKGFTVSSTYRRSFCMIFAADEVVNFTVEDIANKSGAGWLGAVMSDQNNPRYSKNVFFRNNTNLGRGGFSVTYAENVHFVYNTGTGADLNRNLRFVFVYGNRGFGGVRGHGAVYAHIRDNEITQITNDGLSHSIIESNTIRGGRRYGGIYINPQWGLVGNIYRNNRIYSCLHGVNTTHYSYGFSGKVISDAQIVNNVIYNCSGDGIHMTSPYVKLDIRNNIIANCGGYGINYIKTKEPTIIGNNNLWKNAKGDYNGISAGTGDISVDPLFADPAKGDFHLKSKAGRWDPKAKKWVKDNIHSPCIDAGDPKADFSLEPDPNGGRVNLGAYGNTAEASKSAIQQEQQGGRKASADIKGGENMARKASQHQTLSRRLKDHLEESILVFLLRHSPDAEYGGFVTQLDRQGKWYGRRIKRLVPQTRMIWTFSSAHRAGLGGGKYLKAARDGFSFLVKYMWDKEEGGWYWSVTRQGKPSSTRKSIYGQAFGIYGLCEYYFASGDKEALRKAEETFDLLEKHAYDGKHRGYFTGDFTRDWKRQGSSNRSAGTHLHLVESLTSLVRATGKQKYRKRLKELLDILVEKMFLPEHGCIVEVYTEDWKPILDSNTMYVHDLEAAWLIIDGAKALGLKDEKYLERARNLVDYSLKYGWDEKHGGFFQSGPAGRPATNTKKNYNVQGEGLVALATLYRETRDKKYLRKLVEHTEWCLKFQADSKFGEWFTMCTADGKPTMIEKAGLWKAGYHHPRGCLYAAIILESMKQSK